MDKIVTALQARPRAAVRTTRASKLFKAVLAAVHEKKGEKLVSLDLRKIEEAVADFFVLCEASSGVQIKAIADAVEHGVKDATGERPYRREDGAQWTLLDYVNIVVHIFHPEHRQFYNLESLWEDAERTEHPSGDDAPSRA